MTDTKNSTIEQLRSVADEVERLETQLAEAKTQLVERETENSRLLGENQRLSDKLAALELPTAPAVATNPSPIRQVVQSAINGGRQEKPQSQLNRWKEWWRNRPRSRKGSSIDSATISRIALVVGVLVGFFLAFRLAEPWSRILTNESGEATVAIFALVFGAIMVLASAVGAVALSSWFLSRTSSEQ